MDRGDRRYHTQRVKARHLRRLWEESRWFFEPDRPYYSRSKLYWPMHKLTMSGYPKSWDVEFHIRPARKRSNQLEHLIERGVPDDLLDFPDYRKPHIYYW